MVLVYWSQQHRAKAAIGFAAAVGVHTTGEGQQDLIVEAWAGAQ